MTFMFWAVTLVPSLMAEASLKVRSPFAVRTEFSPTVSFPTTMFSPLISAADPKADSPERVMSSKVNTPESFPRTIPTMSMDLAATAELSPASMVPSVRAPSTTNFRSFPKVAVSTVALSAEMSALSPAVMAPMRAFSVALTIRLFLSTPPMAISLPVKEALSPASMSPNTFLSLAVAVKPLPATTVPSALMLSLATSLAPSLRIASTRKMLFAVMERLLPASMLSSETTSPVTSILLLSPRVTFPSPMRVSSFRKVLSPQ